MSCRRWQWHRTGSSWSPVRTVPVAPVWGDLGFFPKGRGSKATTTTIREQCPRPHHKGATGRVRTENQQFPVLCHCQLGQDIPHSTHRSSLRSSTSLKNQNYILFINIFNLERVQRRRRTKMFQTQLLLHDPRNPHKA